MTLTLTLVTPWCHPIPMSLGARPLWDSWASIVIHSWYNGHRTTLSYLIPASWTLHSDQYWTYGTFLITAPPYLIWPFPVWHYVSCTICGLRLIAPNRFLFKTLNKDQSLCFPLSAPLPVLILSDLILSNLICDLWPLWPVHSVTCDLWPLRPVTSVTCDLQQCSSAAPASSWITIYYL